MLLPLLYSSYSYVFPEHNHASLLILPFAIPEMYDPLLSSNKLVICSHELSTKRVGVGRGPERGKELDGQSVLRYHGATKKYEGKTKGPTGLNHGPHIHPVSATHPPSY
jgi:hypothetical protein